MGKHVHIQYNYFIIIIYFRREKSAQSAYSSVLEMRRVWLFKEDFGLFHQDITPQEYEFFRTHAGAFKRMWHEQVGHARVNIAAPSDLPRSFPSSLLSNTPSLTLSLLPLTLTHSPFFPPACDCRPSLSLQSRRFWSLFVNAFEHFIWNYGIMKDFPMKVQSRYQRIPGSWPSRQLHQTAGLAQHMPIALL